MNLLVRQVSIAARWFVTRAALLVCALLISAGWHWVPKALSQALAVNWEEPYIISNTPSNSLWPAIAADAFGGINVVWSEDLDGPEMQPGSEIRPGNSIFVTRWNGNGWSQPVDILFNPENPISPVGEPQIVGDEQGNLHLLFLSFTKLYYSRAPAREAATAHGWSQPILLVDDVVGTSIYRANLIATAAGDIIVVYCESDQVMSLRSEDRGETWSSPQPISNTMDKTLVPGAVRLALDERGRIHAVWSLYDGTGAGREIFYTRSLDEGKTWSDPMAIAVKDPDEYEVDWANLGTTDGSTIHIVYQDGERAWRWHRWSYDGGETWSPPSEILTEWIGETGWAELITDSAGSMHLLLPQRGRGTGPIKHTVRGLLHAMWNGASWMDIALTAAKFGSVLYPRAAITGGNQLHVVWYDEGWGEIWYQHGQSSAPSLLERLDPTAQQVTPTPEPHPTKTATSAPRPFPSATAVQTRTDSTQHISAESGFAVAVGIISALLLVFAVVVARILRW